MHFLLRIIPLSNWFNAFPQVVFPITKYYFWRALFLDKKKQVSEANVRSLGWLFESVVAFSFLQSHGFTSFHYVDQVLCLWLSLDVWFCVCHIVFWGMQLYVHVCLWVWMCSSSQSFKEALKFNTICTLTIVCTVYVSFVLFYFLVPDSVSGDSSQAGF